MDILVPTFSVYSIDESVFVAFGKCLFWQSTVWQDIFCTLNHYLYFESELGKKQNIIKRWNLLKILQFKWKTSSSKGNRGYQERQQKIFYLLTN